MRIEYCTICQSLNFPVYYSINFFFKKKSLLYDISTYYTAFYCNLKCEKEKKKMKLITVQEKFTFISIRLFFTTFYFVKTKVRFLFFSFFSACWKNAKTLSTIWDDSFPKKFQNFMY